jgi:hypothetical protein
MRLPATIFDALAWWWNLHIPMMILSAGRAAPRAGPACSSAAARGDDLCGIAAAVPFRELLFVTCVELHNKGGVITLHNALAKAGGER